MKNDIMKGLRQKYDGAEKSAPKAFGVLPNPSFCHPSAGRACRAIAVAATAGRTVSQSVAVILRKASAAEAAVAD
jgi:hypothetical protein